MHHVVQLTAFEGVPFMAVKPHPITACTLVKGDLCVMPNVIAPHDVFAVWAEFGLCVVGQ
jgi:hypothetical protein